MSEEIRLELGYQKEYESNRSTYKTCFVPECRSNTTTNSIKVFLTVPTSTAKRKLWFDSLGQPERKKVKSTYICEDHFDLKKDLENYLPWLLSGANKKLRENALPRGVFSTSDRIVNNSLPPAEERISPFENSSGSVLSEETLPISISPKSHQDKCCKVDCQNVHTDTSDLMKMKSKSNQTVFKKYADRECQCDILKPSTNPAPDALTKRIKKLTISEDLNETVDSISSYVLDTSYSYEPSNEQCTTTSGEQQLQLQLLKMGVFERHTKLLIEADPLTYLGVLKDSLFVLELLSKASSVSLRNIYLVLKKIRTNSSFSILASDFGISESQAGKIFSKDVHIIADFLDQFIIWPSKEDIASNLPIQFRYRYSDVGSIIDCLEIEIEKPSNAMNQSLSWSQYKGCNTDKRLISITADGLINFMSDGVCGRCSDISIAENCGYLEKLPPNTCVLADRGFKQLDTLLMKKNCKLVRPPSVKKDVKSTKEEVRLTKQIASLRIHVERVISRIRHFQILDIHSRVDNHLLPHLDSMVKIACGLVNLQTSIIKQT